MLWESHAPHRCYDSVEAVGGTHPAEGVVASPPCLIFSKANRASTLRAKEDAADEQVGQIRRIVMLLAPRFVLLEQTDGLRTHCPTAYMGSSRTSGPGCRTDCTIPPWMLTTRAAARTIE